MGPLLMIAALGRAVAAEVKRSNATVSLRVLERTRRASSLAPFSREITPAVVGISVAIKGGANSASIPREARANGCNGPLG
jgi:hypothetical protein